MDVSTDDPGNLPPETPEKTTTVNNSAFIIPRKPTPKKSPLDKVSQTLDVDNMVSLLFRIYRYLYLFFIQLTTYFLHFQVKINDVEFEPENLHIPIGMLCFFVFQQREFSSNPLFLKHSNINMFQSYALQSIQDCIQRDCVQRLSSERTNYFQNIEGMFCKVLDRTSRLNVHLHSFDYYKSYNDLPTKDFCISEMKPREVELYLRILYDHDNLDRCSIGSGSWPQVQRYIDSVKDANDFTMLESPKFKLFKNRHDKLIKDDDQRREECKLLETIKYYADSVFKELTHLNDVPSINFTDGRSRMMVIWHMLFGHGYVKGSVSLLFHSSLYNFVMILFSTLMLISLSRLILGYLH